MQTDEPRTWTIITWNLRGLGRPDLAQVAERMRATGADVVAVQEIRRKQAATLAAHLGMQHAWAVKHYPYSPLLPWTAEGAAILTPHRLEAAGQASLAPAVSRWTFRHRIVQWALVRRPDHSAYRVYNAHLSPGDDSAKRVGQARVVRALVDGHGGAPAIIAGDFNDDGEPQVVDELGGRDAWVLAAPGGDGWTNPADEPRQRIDHVLLPQDATVGAVSVPAGGAEWSALSDHLPVTASFTQLWAHGDFT